MSVAVVICSGLVSLHCRSLDEAEMFFRRALTLSPTDPFMFWPVTGLAHVEMARGNFAEARTWAERSLPVNRHWGATYWMLIAASAQLADMPSAKRHLRDFMEISPATTIASIREGQPDRYPERMAQILEGLRLAGLRAN